MWMEGNGLLNIYIKQLRVVEKNSWRLTISDTQSLVKTGWRQNTNIDVLVQFAKGQFSCEFANLANKSINAFKVA